LQDSHQKGEMMIMMMKTSGYQVGSSAAGKDGGEVI